jgi:hypothetical protein
MKLYKYLVLTFLLGMASSTYATAIDPGVGLRGDGASTPIVGTGFGGTFTNTCSNDTPGDTNCLNFFNNNPESSAFTFVALHLFFNPIPNLDLSYTCDNSLDPFFLSCTPDPSLHEITFSGLGFDATGLCGGEEEDGCQGIPSGGHFSIALESADTPTFTGVADLRVATTPEPASVLLFVVAMGAIALFLKRA